MWKLGRKNTKDDGLVVIGVHTPEFAFEKDQANVAKAVRDLKITYPVAIDSNYAIWKAFNNEYWPAHYFIDAQGNDSLPPFRRRRVRQVRGSDSAVAEGEERESESRRLVQVSAIGAQAAADLDDVQSPETYIGYARQENYVSPEKIQQDAPGVYTAPGRLDVNNWGLAGKWNVGGERAMLVARARQDCFPVSRAGFASWSWGRARTASPSASACCWMAPRRWTITEWTWTVRATGR